MISPGMWSIHLIYRQYFYGQKKKCPASKMPAQCRDAYPRPSGERSDPVLSMNPG
jgi:hypothetical protein